jgi:hypothetical protein|tara:strand:+ start:1806 stop:2093 length:288 start_codon:yes stop_codon:yes gene_type:complete
MIEMRQKTIRLIESIHAKGVFGPCSCGGDVLYYTDKGVRCSTCGKLYGVWADKHFSFIKRAKDLLDKTQKIKSETEEAEEPIFLPSIDGPTAIMH